MNKKLSWDDLANLYDERTEGRARIQKMETIYDWAIRQDFIVVNKDTSLSLEEQEDV